MPLYTGKGVPGQPGFEMKEFEGMYVSSCGKFFSSEPFTPESEKELKKYYKNSDWKQRIKNLRKNK